MIYIHYNNNYTILLKISITFIGYIGDNFKISFDTIYVLI